MQIKSLEKQLIIRIIIQQFTKQSGVDKEGNAIFKQIALARNSY